MNCLSFLQLCVKRIVRKKFSSLLSYYCFSLEHMTSKQQTAIKSSIFDANSHLNRIFLYFDSLNKEFHLGNRLVNSFSNCFSFYKADCSSKERKSQTILCSTHYLIHQQSLLSLTLTLRTMLPYQLLISIHSAIL